jgi:transcriptional regulator with XRE-family HTH domain
MSQDKKPASSNGNVVTLKSVAAHVGLSAGTVSAVLNDAPSAKHIPKPTRERIIAAAQKLDYRPNFFARSLRKRRTFTLGVIAYEIGDGYSSSIIAGIAWVGSTACTEPTKLKLPSWWPTIFRNVVWEKNCFAAPSGSPAKKAFMLSRQK